LQWQYTYYQVKSNPNRIIFITQWQWDDPLVQTYTLPYVGIIQKITKCYPYIVTIGKSNNSITVKKKNGKICIEIPPNKRFLFTGWIMNLLRLRNIIKKKNIKTVHPWCTPAGAWGAILKIWDNKLKLIIDSFEPHAEAMVENGAWKKSGLKFKILFYLEKLEALTANYLIFAAPGMEKYIFEKYQTSVVDFAVKPACIDLVAFSYKSVKNGELLEKYNLKDKIVCVYAGKFGGIYLENETFEFIHLCEQHWGKDRFRFLLLSDISKEYINKMSLGFNIQPSTFIKLFVPHQEVPAYLGLADFAICPVKPVPAKKYCTPIKDGEYWAMGLPVVITPDISVDSQIIKDNNAGAILETFGDEGNMNAIRQIDSIIKGKTRAEIYDKIRPLAEKYRNFSIADEIYKKLYGKNGNN
jgi:glycosyltransferase involved in cell wall biosynthesis